MREKAELDFVRSPEATTWINYVDLNLTKAIESAQEWELEEPYSKYPFIVGSFIACNAGKPKLGAEIAQRGLEVDPSNTTIYNNLCYALLRAGDVNKATLYVNKLKGEKGIESYLYCQATLGLYEYKKRNINKGREIYLDVIEKFRQEKKYNLQAEAVLNFVLAELEACTPESKVIANTALGKHRNNEIIYDHSTSQSCPEKNKYT